MSDEPDPAVLYPEVAAYGSLAAAVGAAAAGQGLSLSMIATRSDLLREATMPSVLPHREALSVSAWHFERRWSISGAANNGPVISGTTADLHQLPGIVLGWAQGASLGEIAEVAPFDVLTGRFEVPDGNPADVIAAQWQYKLKEARQADRPGYLALVEAAYAEPKLRRFYPYTSHWSLCFSATPPPVTPSFATLAAPRGGGYTVQEWWDGPILARVVAPAEAVALAVDRIPRRRP